MVNIVAAISNNGVIGKGNKLPWHLPVDLKYFKQLTTGHTVVMGRKTFESIGKPLPKRTNIVITRDKQFKHDGVFVTHDYRSVFGLKGEVFVIGGRDIYELFLPECNRLYITRVHATIHGDIYFPYIPNHFELKSYKYLKSDEENIYDIDFCVYDKIYKK